MFQQSYQWHAAAQAATMQNNFLDVRWKLLDQRSYVHSKRCPTLGLIPSQVPGCQPVAWLRPATCMSENPAWAGSLLPPPELYLRAWDPLIAPQGRCSLLAKSRKNAPQRVAACATSAAPQRVAGEGWEEGFGKENESWLQYNVNRNRRNPAYHRPCSLDSGLGNPGDKEFGQKWKALSAHHQDRVQQFAGEEVQVCLSRRSFLLLPVEDGSRFSFGLELSGLRLGRAERDSIRHTIMIIMSSPAL